MSDGTYTADYTFLANSPLVSQIEFKQSSTVRMTTTRQHDYLNRLSSISSAPGAQPLLPLSYAYAYNDGNQRIRTTLADGSYWLYEYDALGQVKSGKRYWSDHTPVAGQQNEYAFDDIGNRSTVKSGGDENGANLRTSTYTSNSRNQYTARTVPNTFDVLGIADAASTVTVNGGSAYRKGEYFRKELTVTNSPAAIWMGASVTALNGGTSNTVSGNVFVAQTSESPSYDADGNLTGDGRWTLTWNAENRLTQAESLSGNPTASKRKVVWETDCQGRRIRQTTYDGSGGSYSVTENLKFLFDGWRCQLGSVLLLCLLTNQLLSSVTSAAEPSVVPKTLSQLTALTKSDHAWLQRRALQEMAVKSVVDLSYSDALAELLWDPKAVEVQLWCITEVAGVGAPVVFDVGRRVGVPGRLASAPLLALGRMGKRAYGAAPGIRALAGDPATDVSRKTTFAIALANMGTEVAKNDTLITEALNRGGPEALQALAELGVCRT